MGFFSRLATFFNIRANAALDKAEDPGQVMDYSYSKQVEQLQQLRRSIADVVTNEKRLEMQQTQLIEKTNRLDQQALQALQAANVQSPDLVLIAMTWLSDQLPVTYLDMKWGPMLVVDLYPGAR